jgi:hypothetical protein
MPKKFTDAPIVYAELIYQWKACCNLEAELAHDAEAVAHFQRRQREIERDLERFGR